MTGLLLNLAKKAAGSWPEAMFQPVVAWLTFPFH